MNKSFVTSFKWKQPNGKVDFSAVVSFDDNAKLWKCDVSSTLSVNKDDTATIMLSKYSLSFAVEWMALEYAQRIRKEELEIPEI